MKAVELKKIALEIKDKIPYQRTKDSPTIKYYTDWKRYEKHLERPASRETVPNKEWLEKIIDKPERPTIIIKPYEQVIYPSSTKAEISILNLDSAEDNIISLVDPHEGKMLALHIARLEKAVTIRVPEYEAAKIRVIIMHPKEGHMPVHIKTVLENNASLELELLTGSREPSGLVTLTLEEHVGNNASVSNLALLDIDADSTFYGIRRAVLSEKATNKMNTIITGGYMTHFKDESIQRGVLSSVEINSSIFSYKNERVDYITNTINDATDTTAEITVKGFNLGGHLIHRGTIKATENGYDSVNKLESILIPLTSEGYTVSVPMLEVDTDIVKEGAHSADISSLVEEQIFYLKSRGLSLEEAISLAIQSTILGVLLYAEEAEYEQAEELALQLANEFLRKRCS